MESIKQIFRFCECSFLYRMVLYFHQRTELYSQYKLESKYDLQFTSFILTFMTEYCLFLMFEEN